MLKKQNIALLVLTAAVPVTALLPMPTKAA